MRILGFLKQVLLASVAFVASSVARVGLVSPAAGGQAVSAATTAVQAIFALWARVLDVADWAFWGALRLWVSVVMFWWVSLPLRVAVLLFRATKAVVYALFSLFLACVPGGHAVLQRRHGHLSRC